jgi:hypothetical protein
VKQTMIFFAAALLLWALNLTVPSPLFPGAVKETERITAEAMNAYTAPVNRDDLYTAVYAAIARGVPAQKVRVLTLAAAGSGRPPAELSYYLGAVADLGRSGVPTAPLVSLLLEGMARGFTAEALRGSLGSSARDLTLCTSIARLHVQGREGAEDERLELLVKALFAALKVGFTPGELERASVAARQRGMPPGAFVVALEATMALKGLGATGDQAVRLADAALEKGWSAREVARLPALFAAALREGASKGPTADASAVVDDLIRKIQTGEIPPGGPEQTQSKERSRESAPSSGGGGGAGSGGGGGGGGSGGTGSGSGGGSGGGGGGSGSGGGGSGKGSPR